MGTITLEIAGSEKYFVHLHYVKSHPNPDPDTFDLVLTPEEATGVTYFDEVVIKKDGVTEYVGFVEEITPEIGEDGLEYSITGRCYKLIIWKKFTERFQESREIGPEDSDAAEIESSFFGEVYPKELIQFILRCPISEHPKGKVRHKIGWGICSDFWECCANQTADGYYPQWVCLRYSGLAWRGTAGLSGGTAVKLEVDNFSHDNEEMNTHGPEPWLDSDDGLNSHVEPWDYHNEQIEGDFTFEHLDPAATMPYSVLLVIKHSSITKGNEELKAELGYDGVGWFRVGYLASTGGGFEFEEQVFDVTYILDTIDKINGAKLRLNIRANWTGMYRISYAYLNVLYLSGDLALEGQQAGDWFVIDLGLPYDRVTGMLMECRNTPNAYARNYKIEWASVSNACENNYGADDSKWHDFDPTVNVTSNEARDILHSWIPQDEVEAIRIKLTLSADQPWEISQVYIWEADLRTYRVMDE